MPQNYRPHTMPYLDEDGRWRVKRRHGVDAELCAADAVDSYTQADWDAVAASVQALVAADVAATGITQDVPQPGPLSISYYGNSVGENWAHIQTPMYELVEYL